MFSIGKKSFALAVSIACTGVLWASEGDKQETNKDHYLDVMTEFESYQTQTQSEFEAFEAALNEAYDAFIGDVEKTWGDKVFTNTHQWVEYDASLKQRTIVDYLNDQVVIEYLDVNPEQVTKGNVAQELQHVFSTSMKSALDGDPVLSKATESSGVQISVSSESESMAMVPTSVDSKNTNSVAVAESVINAGNVNSSYLPASRRLTVVVELPEEYGMYKADRYWKATSEYAKKWQLEPALVMAIIHTESSFNPMARSRIPAYGLMQIVPRTAGRDAAQAIYGKSKLLKPDYLFDPNKNIRVGSAYLHVLNYRYLKGIHNPESRLYCTIAAYNTGTANVARAFIEQKSMQKAYDRINQLEPSEVYDILANNLPYTETRNYLKKVVGRYQLYIN